MQDLVLNPSLAKTKVFQFENKLKWGTSKNNDFRPFKYIYWLFNINFQFFVPCNNYIFVEEYYQENSFSKVIDFKTI